MNAGPCPYRGLTPYLKEDQPYFFGRNRECEIIISNLYASPLTIFYGASGVGKSSVLLAGVVPQLDAQPDVALVVFRDWQVPDFAASFKSAIWDAASVRCPELPPVDPRLSLDAFLGRVLEHFKGNLFLILDQFEEYFVYDTADFDAELARAINRRDLEANFLLSLREDGLSRLDRLRHRIPNLLTNLLRLDHLNLEAARQAILRPICVHNQRARADGYHRVIPEKALVTAILDEVQTGQVTLGDARAPRSQTAAVTSGRVETPFLQIVLVRLWEAEAGKVPHALRLATFRELGGAERIVGGHLDKCLQNLTPPERELATRAMRYLVTPSRTKIALSAADLAQFVGAPKEAVRDVCRKLADPTSRVLSPVSDSRPGAETRYELYHDTLAPAVLDWVQRAESEELERKRREEDERQRQGESLRQLRRWLLALGMVSILACATGAFALVQRSRASKAARNETEARLAAELQLGIAQANRLAASSADALRQDPELALLLAIEADRVAPTNRPLTQPQIAMRRALNAANLRLRLELGSGENVTAAAFSPDGQWIVAGDASGRMAVWDLHQPTLQPAHQWASGHDTIDLVDFVGNTGRMLGANGALTLWNLDGSVLKRMQAPWLTGDGANPAITMAVSPNGNWAVVARSGGGLEWWDLTSPTDLVLRLGGPKSDVVGLQFTPDNAWLSAVTDELDNSILLWRTGDIVQRSSPADPPPFRVLPVTNGILSSVRFTPDNRRVIASAGNQVLLWALATNTPPARIDNGARVFDARMAADGSRCFTAGQDYRAIIWNRTEYGTNGRPTWTRAQELRHLGAVVALDVSPDESLVATASTDQLVRVWEVATGNLVAELRGHSRPVAGVLFSPDNRWLLSEADGEPPRVWQWSGGFVDESTRLDGSQQPIETIAISRQGNWLAAGDFGGRIFALRQQAGPKPYVRADARALATDPIRNLFFTPDANLLLARGSRSLPAAWPLDPFGAPEIQSGLAKAGGWNGANDADLEPNGVRVALAFPGGTVGICEAYTGNLTRSRRVASEGDGEVTAVRWCGTRSIVAAVTTAPSNDEIPGPNPGRSAPPNRVNLAIQSANLPVQSYPLPLRRSPDAVPQSELRLWQWNEDQVRTGPTTDPILQLAMSQDGRWLATTHAGSEALRIWDLGPGAAAFVPALQPISTSGGGTSQVSVLRFRSDGNWLAAGYSDGTVVLQNPGGRSQPISRALLANVVHALDFSPEGDCLLAAGGNVIKIVAVPDLVELASIPSPSGVVTTARFGVARNEIAVGTSSGALQFVTWTGAADGPGLRALAQYRVTRQLSASEKQTYDIAPEAPR